MPTIVPEKWRQRLLQVAAPFVLVENQSTRRLTLASRMASMTAPSEFVLEQLREGADFTVYRGRQRGSPNPVLAVAVAAERPTPQILRRLEHENTLAAELDA